MKKILVLVVCLLLVVATSAFATIVGTKHDLSSSGVANNEVCVFCHTPHNASTSPLAPLWSHSSSAATYTTYGNPFGTIQGTSTQPSGVSKACLSCHDGSVAVGSVANGKYAGSYAAGPYTAGQSMTGGALLGQDLSNDHPVSITYRNDLDPGLRPSTGAVVSNTSGTSAQLYGTGPNYTVECASCHQVHDSTNTPFLRASNVQSQLCLICHLK